MIPSKPGIYYDVPFSVYLKIKAVSSSVLKAHLKSPAHAKMGVKTTNAMRDGRILHAMILEPEKVKDYIRTAPDGNKNGKAFKDAVSKEYGINYESTWADALFQIEAKYPELTIADKSTIDSLKATADSLKDVPEIMKLLKDTKREVTAIWERDGVLCKARYDALGKWAVDIKSTKDSSPRRFNSQAFDLGYHIQDAWYMSGLKALDIEAQGMAFIAFEKEEPVNPMIYVFGEFERDLARKETDSLFEEHLKCLESDVWGGYEVVTGSRIHTLEVPMWYQSKYKEVK